MGRCLHRGAELVPPAVVVLVLLPVDVVPEALLPVRAPRSFVSGVAQTMRKGMVRPSI